MDDFVKGAFDNPKYRKAFCMALAPLWFAHWGDMSGRDKKRCWFGFEDQVKTTISDLTEEKDDLVSAFMLAAYKKVRT